MNTFALGLHSAHQSVEKYYEYPFKLTPDLLIHFESYGGGAGPAALMVMALTDAGKHAPFPGDPMPQEVLETAVALLDRIIQHPEPAAFDLAHQINDALVAATAHDNPATVITAWSICEVILSRRWLAHVEAIFVDQIGELSNTKRKYYQKDFTASEIIEFLWLSGKITKEEYADLNQARKARNGWIHEIAVPRRETALLTFRLALRLFNEEFGIDITAEPSGGSVYVP